jgi:serine/threonine protein kinase
MGEKERMESDPDRTRSAETPEPEHGEGASAQVLERLQNRIGKESRYQILGEFARGGMGAILKVWDQDLRRTLAMKVVLGKAEPKEKGSTPAVDEKSLGRFLEEAQITGQLDHPGIVPVYELGLDTDGQVFFTMQLVKGQDLKHIFDLVRDGKEGWTQTRALTVLLKVCEAMAYSHSKGVIHRDLKPANIMVGRFGEVYVMDWGLAKVLGHEDTHDLRIKAPDTTGSLQTEGREEREQNPDTPLVTMDGAVVGTPAYMPPEQARGDVDKLDRRSDVYALGAILYHLLTGQMPYAVPGARATPHGVWRWVLEGPPTPMSKVVPSIPAELTAICEKAMSRKQEDRYSDMGQLAEDLRNYQERRPVRAYGGSARRWIRSYWRRSSRLSKSSLVLCYSTLLLVVGPILVGLRDPGFGAVTGTLLVIFVMMLPFAALVSPGGPRGLSAIAFLPTVAWFGFWAVYWGIEGSALTETTVIGDDYREQVDSLVNEILDEHLSPEHRAIVRADVDFQSELRDATLHMSDLHKPFISSDWLHESAWRRVDPDREHTMDTVRGLRFARATVAMTPNDAKRHQTLAWALFANGQYEEALTELERAVDLAPHERVDYEVHLQRMRSMIETAKKP